MDRVAGGYISADARVLASGRNECWHAVKERAHDTKKLHMTRQT